MEPVVKSFDKGMVDLFPLRELVKVFSKIIEKHCLERTKVLGSLKEACDVVRALPVRCVLYIT